jgi:hypothetical protein
LEKERIAKLERENKRIADLERERLADLETKRLADLEKERIAELERENKRIADLETKRLADLETKRLADLETKRLADLERERLADLEKDRLADLERMAKTRKLTESTQVRITVKHGIELLKQMQNSNDTMYEETIAAMIISYLDTSTAYDLKNLLKFMTFSQKKDCLLYLIELRYQGNTESDMKEGSRLYKLFNP